MAETMIVALECVREEPSGAGWRWMCGECGLSSRDGRSVLLLTAAQDDDVGLSWRR